jgi:membrane-associated phospholipid phosphatase
LLTIPVFVVVVLFSFNSLKQAIFLSLLILGGVVLPVVIRLYTKSKNGSYTNFDVSDRHQRKSLFIFTIPLLVILTFVLFSTHQPMKVCYSVLFATVLVVTAQIVNFFLKSSLHVSLTFFLAFLALNINLWLGIFFFLLTLLIGWSRIELKRHTPKEVIAGAFLGLSVGGVMFYFLNFAPINSKDKHVRPNSKP